MHLPILLRFPQILSNQLRTLTAAYQDAIAQFEYRGTTLPCVSYEVNPRREVVEEFLRKASVSRGFGMWIQSGALCGRSSGSNAETLLICNGFKDESFCRLACFSSPGRQASGDRHRKTKRTQDAASRCS